MARIHFTGQINKNNNLPICKTSWTLPDFAKFSPCLNFSLEPDARHEYKRISSSFSGNEWYAIRNCSTSGIGGL